MPSFVTNGENVTEGRILVIIGMFSNLSVYLCIFTRHCNILVSKSIYFYEGKKCLSIARLLYHKTCQYFIIPVNSIVELDLRKKTRVPNFLRTFPQVFPALRMQTPFKCSFIWSFLGSLYFALRNSTFSPFKWSFSRKSQQQNFSQRNAIRVGMCLNILLWTLEMWVYIWYMYSYINMYSYIYMYVFRFIYIYMHS